MEYHPLKTDLISFIHHEHKNPISKIKTDVHLYMDEVNRPLNDKQRNLLEPIEESLERLNGNIYELLYFSTTEIDKIAVEINNIYYLLKKLSEEMNEYNCREIYNNKDIIADIFNYINYLMEYSTKLVKEETYKKFEAFKKEVQIIETMNSREELKSEKWWLSEQQFENVLMESPFYQELTANEKDEMFQRIVKIVSK